MNRPIHAFTLATLFLSVTAVKAAEFSLQNSRQTYATQLEKIETSFIANRADWGERYAARLRAIEKQVQAAGELDKLLAIRDEILRFSDSRTLSGIDEEKLLQDIVELRSDFKDSDTRSRQSWGEDVMRLTVKYVQFLESQKKRLTQEGNIDTAIMVNKEIQRVQTSGIVKEAQSVTKSATPKKQPGPGSTAGTPPEHALSARLKTIRVEELQLDPYHPSSMFEVLHRTLRASGIDLKSVAKRMQERHVTVRSSGSDPRTRNTVRVMGDRFPYQGRPKRVLQNVSALEALTEISRTFAIGYKLEPRAVVFVDAGTEGSTWHALEISLPALTAAFKSNSANAKSMYIGKEIHITGVYKRSGKSSFVLEGGKIRAEFDTKQVNPSTLAKVREIGDRTRPSIKMRGPTRLGNSRPAGRQRLRVWCAGELKSFGGVSESLVITRCRDVAWRYE
jgi:hypothetical protein